VEFPPGWIWSKEKHLLSSSPIDSISRLKQSVRSLLDGKTSSYGQKTMDGKKSWKKVRGATVKNHFTQSVLFIFTLDSTWDFPFHHFWWTSELELSLSKVFHCHFNVKSVRFVFSVRFSSALYITNLIWFALLRKHLTATIPKISRKWIEKTCLHSSHIYKLSNLLCSLL